MSFTTPNRQTDCFEWSGTVITGHHRTALAPHEYSVTFVPTACKNISVLKLLLKRVEENRSKKKKKLLEYMFAITWFVVEFGSHVSGISTPKCSGHSEVQQVVMFGYPL